MSASTRPISIEIDTQAQLVAMTRGEEWGAGHELELPRVHASIPAMIVLLICKHVTVL